MNKTSLTLLLAAACFTGCDSKKSASENLGPEVVHREGEPDLFRLGQDDAEMNQAMEKARGSVEQFIPVLKSPGAGQMGFTVKKPFTEGKNTEHIWLTEVSFDGTKFTGTVNNEPVDVKNVKFGAKVTVGKSEISDWFYVENGKLVGGYTIRLLYSRMDAAGKKDFADQTGFKLE